MAITLCQHEDLQGRLFPEQERSAKCRLVEGFLPLVIRIATQQQRFFRRLSLSDLIQEGNIGLLQAVEDYDFTAMRGRFFAYATACIRNAIIRALPRDSLVRIPRCEFWRLAQQGRLKELDRSQPMSLDATNEQDSSLYDVLPAPSQITPVASNAVRLQVETLLARLTPREQTVLRLYYGLEESDGRRLTRQEIAALLGVVPGTVQGALKCALRKLRTAPKERANPAHGQPMQDAERQAQRLARRAEQEASLVQAYTRLEVQGLPITMLALAREAQVGTTMASAGEPCRNAWNGPMPNSCRLKQQSPSSDWRGQPGSVNERPATFCMCSVAPLVRRVPGRRQFDAQETGKVRHVMLLRRSRQPK